MRKGGATPPPNIPKFRGDFRPSVKLLKKKFRTGRPPPAYAKSSKGKTRKISRFKDGKSRRKKRKPD